MTWGPIVFLNEEGGAFQNWGACYVHTPGGSEACGHEVQQFQGCLADECSECPGGDAQECHKKAAGNRLTCGRYDYVECNGRLNELNAACNLLTKVLSVLCGNGNTL